MNENINTKILRLTEVKAKTGLGRSSLYNLVSLGKFPQQVRLGPRTVGWIESEVESWLQQQIASSRSARDFHK